MESYPSKRLKVVPKPSEILRKQAPQLLSIEDICQWGQELSADPGEVEEDTRTAFDDHGQPVARSYNRARRIDRAIDELLGLCKGIAADGKVNEAEAQFLMDWMRINCEAADQWPANILYGRLTEMLADRHLDHQEQAELFALLREITQSGKPSGEYVANLSTTLPLTIPAPQIHFAERIFCFMGRFVSGTRQQCEGAVIVRGGTVQRVPTNDTDYLVIGTMGSADWIHSTYGRKIEAAVELQKRGLPVAIVSEQHWLTYLKGRRLE